MLFLNKYYDKKIVFYQFVSVIFIIFRTLINLLSIFLIQKILDSVINKDFNKTFIFVKYLFIILIFYFLLLFFSQYFLRKLFFLGNFSVLEFFYSKFLKNDYNTVKDLNSGNLLSKLTMDSIKISDWYSQGKVILTTQIFILSSILIFMSSYNFFITFVLFVIILICFFIVKFLSKKLSVLMQEEQSFLGKTNQYILQSILGFFDLKQLNKEDYFINYLKNNILKDRIIVNNSIAKYFSLYVGISATVAFILPIISLLISIYFIINKDFSVGSAIAIFSTVRMLDEPINAISNQITIRQTAFKIESELCSLFDESNGEDKYNNYKNLKLSNFENININIEKFYYMDNNILNNFNLNIEKGDFLVLKGKSGVGKTTLSNLILKNLKSDSFDFFGSLLVNGFDIYSDKNQNMFFDFLKVNQEPYIYESSLKENILLGDNFDDRLDEVIDTMCLKDLVERLGYNYLLKENGKNLSGGEKQRIELARILIRRPEFVILDEPTSAMNSKLSRKLAENIHKYFKKHSITTMIITHSSEFDVYANKIKELK